MSFIPRHCVWIQQIWIVEETTGTIVHLITRHEETIQHLWRSVEASNNQADIAVSHSVEVLTALKKSVETSLDKLVQDISRRRKTIEKQPKGWITGMQQEISGLKKKRSELEQLAQTDLFNALKNMSEFDSAPQNIWFVHIDPPNYNSTVLRAVSELEKEFVRKTSRLVEDDLNRVREFMKIVQLNRHTAHPQLFVFDDGTEVQHRYVKSHVPDRPDRFNKGLYVLGTILFYGRFYFEVVVSEKSEWTLGVTNDSVTRKGNITLNPENGFWTLSLRNNKYYASAVPEICFQMRHSPVMVGVFVDSEDHTVSFYDVGATYLIYTYTDCCFERALYPFFSPGQFCGFSNRAPLVMN